MRGIKGGGLLRLHLEEGGVPAPAPPTPLPSLPHHLCRPIQAGLRAQTVQLGSSLWSHKVVESNCTHPSPPPSLPPRLCRQLQAELGALRAQAVQLGSSLRSREKEVERLSRAVEEGQGELRGKEAGRQAAEGHAIQSGLEAAAARAKVSGAGGGGAGRAEGEGGGSAGS